jgi:hypothetical protein
MAVNQTAQDHLLPCGRDVETVWERLAEVEAGRADAHELTCDECGQVRAALIAVRAATTELINDESQPSPGLTGRIMSAVRAEVRRRDLLPLPTTEHGPRRVSEQAVAAVLRFAADGVPGVRARRCRVTATPPTPPSATQATLDTPITPATPPSATQAAGPAAPGEAHGAAGAGETLLTVELGIAVSYGAFAADALDVVRARVIAAAEGRIGLRVHRLDLTVTDLYDS